MEEEKTEIEGGREHFHLKLNYAWQGSWSKREEERWMERERGEERTHLRRGMGGRWRGGGVGRAKEIKNEEEVGGEGVFLPCFRVVVGGESCRYTSEPVVSTELQVILLNS